MIGNCPSGFLCTPTIEVVHPARDVTPSERPPVGHATGADPHGVTGQRHHHPLGLGAAQVPEVLAVAEGALVDALREPATPAEVAVAAGGEEGGHHPVASSEAAHL